MVSFGYSYEMTRNTANVCECSDMIGH